MQLGNLFQFHPSQVSKCSRHNVIRLPMYCLRADVNGICGSFDGTSGVARYVQSRLVDSRIVRQGSLIAAD